MKHIYNILFIALAVIFFSCQADDEASMSKVGYLRLDVSESNEVVTKADETYHPEVFSVTIKNTTTEEVKEYPEWSKDETKLIELSEGTWTITATSANFDNESGFDKPYYAGTKDVTISAGKEASETLTCTLANVKVSVVFADDLLEKYADRTIMVNVSDKDEKYTPLTFSKDKCGKEVQGYFPVADLKTEISISRPASSGESTPYTMTREITGVKAQQYYVLTYQIENTGNGDFNVKYDPNLNEYEYTFVVDPVAKNTAILSSNPWAKFAYLTAESVTSVDGSDISSLKFQYRTKGADEAAWQELETTTEGDADAKVYKATATGLTANTAYEYRLVNSDRSFEVLSEFTTESAVELQNGGFEAWCTASDNKSAYPNASPDVKFWDTSNTGANTIGKRNPTNETTDPIIEGKKAARLNSQFVGFGALGAFAAASLYVGSFGAVSGMSATVNFGQPFTSRPIALHGYYQYAPVAISNIDEGKIAEGGLTVKKGDMDECAIYIALATDVITVDNSDVTKLFNPNDDRIIAYGTLPSGAATDETENNGYKEFSIPLQYKEDKFDKKPTHLIIVCSASKYGDYMTGGNGSTLYVDDFSLIYDGEPTIWDLSANN